MIDNVKATVLLGRSLTAFEEMAKEGIILEEVLSGTPEYLTSASQEFLASLIDDIRTILEEA